MSEFRSQDFERFAEQFNGAHSRIMLTGRNTASWSFRQVQLGDISVHAAEEGGPNVNEGALWPNVSCVLVPLARRHVMHLNGQGFGPGSLALAGPGQAFRGASRDRDSWATIVLRADAIADLLDIDDGLVGRWLGGVSVIRSSEICVERLAKAAARIVDGLAAAETVAAPVAETLRDGVIEALAAALNAEQSGSAEHHGRPRKSRTVALRRVIEYLRSSPQPPRGVGDLVSAADVSERTLRSMMLEEYGMGPHRYLELIRLHRLRTLLRTGDPAATTVRESAAAAGISDVKTVGRRYHLLFGENPSVTLRTKPR